MAVSSQARLAPGHRKPHVLWVDDRIKDFRAILRGLQDNGLIVETASSINDALARISAKVFDIFLLDLLIGGDRPYDLIPHITRRSPAAPIFVISGYLAMEQAQSDVEKLRALAEKSTIVAVDKNDIPMPEDSHFSEFVRYLNGVRDASIGADVWPGRGFDNRVELDAAGGISFPSYTDFTSLSIKEQGEFLSILRDRNSSVIESELKKGNVWVTFCGKWDEPALTAATFDEVLTGEELAEFGRKRGYAPLAFGTIAMVDDVSARSCSHSAKIEGYPVIKISRRVDDTVRDVRFHWDTGNPINMICARTYESIGWLKAGAVVHYHANIGGSGLHVRKFTLYDTIATDAVGTTKVIQLSGLAVLDWQESRFALVCDSNCGAEGQSAGDLCRFRTGLLGRNLQTACSEPFIVDCAEGTIIFGAKASKRIT